MAEVTFTCMTCGAQAQGATPARRYCDPCKNKKGQARRQAYYRSGLQGTIIGSDFTCIDCRGTFSRTGPAQKRCSECRRERRRVETVEWKERTNYLHLKPGAKTRVGDTVVCGGCSVRFVKRATYEKYCDPCKKRSGSIRYREPWRKIQNSMSSRLTKAIRRQKSGSSWSCYFEYTLSDLMLHLEKQFLPGMSWDNYGKWHIDHIVPVADFNLECDDELRACFAISNLRPLWAKDNRKKSAQRVYLI